MVIGAGVCFINYSQYPTVSARILIVMALLGGACCAVAWFKTQTDRRGRFELRDKLLGSLALQGDEKVLDFGCGGGLFAVGAAKLLKTGKVTGADPWTFGASMDGAKENAKTEGVADRVRFETCNPFKLSYPENHFDVVLSSEFLHRLEDHNERTSAMREMYRVTKSGGRILIFDSGDTGYYAQVLREIGAKDVALSAYSFPWLIPHRSISGSK